jgi:hypothetical protein
MLAFVSSVLCAAPLPQSSIHHNANSCGQEPEFVVVQFWQFRYQPVAIIQKSIQARISTECAEFRVPTAG